MVDQEQRLVGIITIDDIVDVIEGNTEDFYKMAAIGPHEEDYMIQVYLLWPVKGSLAFNINDFSYLYRIFNKAL